MATNLALDDDLIQEALRIGGHHSKKDAVNQALREYIARHRQAEIITMFGTVDFDPKFDHKAGRKRP